MSAKAVFRAIARFAQDNNGHAELAHPVGDARTAV